MNTAQFLLTSIKQTNSIDLVTVFNAILTSRQTREKLQRSRRMLSVSENTLLDLHNFSYDTKAEFINC